MVKKGFTIVALLALLISAIGCSKSSGSGNGKIVVSSKHFTESMILGEMIAQLIEAKTELKVDRKLNLGPTDITYKAITNGDIDVYTEYDGTIYSSYLKIKDPITDPKGVYDLVNKQLQEQLKLKMTKPLGFNNTFTLSLPKSIAEKNNLKTYSDLQKISDQFVLGLDYEFNTREPDGWKGLNKVYGFNFKKVVAMEGGLKYKAIEEDQIQVTDAFATDGQLEAHKLVVLQDDKNFFPPYNAAPIIRMQTLEEHPELEDILNSLAGKISDADMQKLNYKVDGEKKSEVDVVKEFLKAQGLI